ncbi:MAG: metallophosphoesterase, partial [Christensenellaceae bacterium]|nr:metallophosphoesterase [Christensenellaceae bacterium]
MTYLLHISDLHLVTDPLWNNMKNVILDSVRKQLENVPLGEKLLVITGDFHNFVEKNFDQAKEFLPQLIDAMGIEADKDVFVIPGNHDVSNKIPAEIDRRIIITGVKSDPNMLHERVEQLLSCYEPYIEMIKSVKVYQEDSGRLPVRVHVRTWRKKLHLLHLNTSLIADGKTKDGQMTDELTATSDEIRKKLRSGGLPCIAIGHNSFFDLSERQQKMLTGMFSKENISAYLCGDRHQRNTERKENRISLGQKYSSVSIPNIVSYRTSTDENDEYSDFGMIWHIWNEETGRVDLKFMRWDPDDQGELQPDGEDFYNFRYALQASTGGKSQASTGTTNTCWLSNSDLLRSKSSSVKPNHIQGFLLGGRCGWNLAFSDKIIVERNIVDTLYQYAVNGGVHALTGPGGEGKSTVLMQMCAKLVKSGVSVFYYRGYGRLDLPEEVPENSVFVLDNPPDRPDFKQFLDTVIGYGYTLILGARENEWNLLKKSLRISDRDVLDVPMQTLTAKEAWAFADCVCNNLRHSKSRREIKEIFQTRSYGFLYAAMLMAVSDKNSLEEIAHEIVSNLSERSMDALHLLAHIVLSEHYNVRFEYEQFRYVCNKLKLSPGDGRSALSREISLNGGVYQTRHERISKLFFEELFSDSGLLDSEDIDNVLTNLFELHLANYRSAYGHLKNKFKNSIMQLSGGLAYASINAQQYLINRIIDEVKAQPPRYFDQLPLYINDEGVQLLFYRQCFDRKWISSASLRNWCHLLLKKGSPWTTLEPYFPAWIMRKACIKRSADSNAWMAWAQLESKHGKIGDYESENTARWIFREACINHNADGSVWMAWAQLEVQQNNVGDYESENTARWIFRKACVEKNTDGKVWLAWA